MTGQLRVHVNGYVIYYVGNAWQVWRKEGNKRTWVADYASYVTAVESVVTLTAG